MKPKRQLIYFRDYFWKFFNDQTEKVKDKIDYEKDERYRNI